MADLPGKALARELIDGSEAESRATPMEDVIAAVRERGMDKDTANRLFGRLWTLERMFYYIYGGWGQGLEMNDFPPSVKYLFAKQIVDESTHEMLYMDALLRHGCGIDRQAELFHHFCGRALDRLATDNRRHRDDRGPAGAQGLSATRHAEDGVDTDKGV